jgi:hypothetical protein
VNRLKVRDELGELAQVIKDDFAPAAGDPLLANTGLVEECAECALDGVKAESLRRVVKRRPCSRSRRDGRLKVGGRYSEVRVRPCVEDGSGI